MESKENGSLDTDRGFVAGVASSVTSVANVANSLVDAFKDKVQAIYPGECQIIVYSRVSPDNTA